MTSRTGSCRNVVVKKAKALIQPIIRFSQR